MRLLLMNAFLFAFGIVCFSKTAYAVQSNDKTTLTFYYDNNEGRREGTNFSESNFGKWTKDIVKVIFDSSFSEYQNLSSTSAWFSGCTLLETINGLNYLNTNNVKDMSSMFDNCIALKELDFSNFNTSNVENMSFMFSKCKFVSLDLKSFDTRNVTDMSFMFSKCLLLKKLDISSFNTEKVVTMRGMFQVCNSLEYINVSSFNTNSVENMENMFGDCHQLKRLDLSSFDTRNVNNMKWMFSYCHNIESIDISNFNTEKVTDMSYMFKECYYLETIDLSSFNTENVLDMRWMFESCSFLRTIYATDWSMSRSLKSDDMFDSCRQLVGEKGTCYDREHTDAQYAHIDGGSDFPGYFSDKNSTNLNTIKESDQIDAYYDLNGNRSIYPHNGFNIVKMKKRYVYKYMTK